LHRSWRKTLEKASKVSLQALPVDLHRRVKAEIRTMSLQQSVHSQPGCQSRERPYFLLAPRRSEGSGRPVGAWEFIAGLEALPGRPIAHTR